MEAVHVIIMNSRQRQVLHTVEMAVQVIRNGETDVGWFYIQLKGLYI